MAYCQQVFQYLSMEMIVSCLEEARYKILKVLNPPPPLPPRPYQHQNNLVQIGLKTRCSKITKEDKN